LSEVDELMKKLRSQIRYRAEHILIPYLRGAVEFLIGHGRSAAGARVLQLAERLEKALSRAAEVDVKIERESKTVPHADSIHPTIGVAAELASYAPPHAPGRKFFSLRRYHGAPHLPWILID